jgi:hypothetical protein
MTDNPYYFSGVEIPYMESWALLDSGGNILLIDQNLLIIKILESVPYTNTHKVVRLSSLKNYKVVKKYLNNDTCLKFRVFGYKIMPSIEQKVQSQQKLFEMRFKVCELLTKLPGDLIQLAGAMPLLYLMFGDDTQTAELISKEYTQFEEQLKQVRVGLRGLYEPQ